MLSKKIGIFLKMFFVFGIMCFMVGRAISEEKKVEEINRIVNPCLANQSKGVGFSAPFDMMALAQGFDAEASKLVKVGWYTLNEGNAPDLVFELRPDDGEGLPSSEILASVEVPDAKQACWNYTYADLKYDKLIKGKRYFVVIHAKDWKGDAVDHSGSYGNDEGEIRGCSGGSEGPWKENDGERYAYWSIVVQYQLTLADRAEMEKSAENARVEKLSAVMKDVIKKIEGKIKQKGGSIPKMVVRVEPATRLVYRDEPRLEWGESGNAVEGIKFHSVRDEYESNQIVLINSSKVKLVVKGIESSDLNQEAGNGVISGKDIEVSIVDYIYQGDISTGKWIPDGLPPFREVEIGSNEYKVMWVTVHVVKGIAAGRYSGKLNVKLSEGGDVVVPIDVKVADLELPEESKLKTSFWFASPGQAGKFYGMKKFTIDDTMPYLDIMSTHRISPGNIMFPALPRSEEFGNVETMITVYKEKDGRFSYDFSNMDKLMAAMKERHMNAVNLNLFGSWAYSGFEYFDVIDRVSGKVERYKPGAKWEERGKWLTTAELDEVYGGWLREAYKRYKDNYKDILYYQGFDEPQENTYGDIVKVYKKVGEWAPGIPRLITILTHPVDKMASEVDIWCPLDHFFDPAVVVSVERAKGKEVWWYVIGNRLSVGLQPLESRTLGWTTFKYDLHGLLYWSINASWTGDGKKVINVYEKESDRWPNRPFVLPGNPPQDQTGFLVYPGPKGPVSSQRLENLRDGIEEYDLLYELSEKVKAAGSRGETNSVWYKEASELVKVPDEIAPDHKKCITDSKRMEYWRERLLTLLATAPGK